MSHKRKAISGFKLVKSNDRSVPEISAVCKRYEMLKEGYKAAADLNISLAEMCLEADNEALSVCEEKLTECE